MTLSAAFTRIRADYRFHTQSYQAGLGRYLRIYDADVLETRADKGFSLRRTLRDYRAYITEILRKRLPAVSIYAYLGYYQFSSNLCILHYSLFYFQTRL